MSKLRDVRRHRGFRALEVAKAVGISGPVLSVIENRVYVAKPEVREKLANFFDLPITKLFQVDGLTRK
jgi:transcriptional regulator with XRE-family HTH domain